VYHPLFVWGGVGVPPSTFYLRADYPGGQGPRAWEPRAYVWSLNGQRRDLVAEQRYIIWNHCHEASQAWQAEKARNQEEANRKRREAARERERTEVGTFKPMSDEARYLTWRHEQGDSGKPVVEQSVPPPEKEHKERQSKATASKTNPGAVARGGERIVPRALLQV